VIGHLEDATAWDLLWDAREAYAHALEARAKGWSDPVTDAGTGGSAGVLARRGRQRLVLVVWAGTQHRE